MCMREKRAAKVKQVRYATREDFERVFSEDLNQLYQLAFLLTGDGAKAERCFVAGLEDSVKDNAVFAEWARSWAKRTIIRNAIQAMNPRPGRHDSSRSPAGLADPGQSSLEPTRDFLFKAVLALDDFERFVFVMSVLEHYSDQDCALLLGSTRGEVEEARTRALQKLSGWRDMAFPGKGNEENSFTGKPMPPLKQTS